MCNCLVESQLVHDPLSIVGNIVKPQASVAIEREVRAESAPLEVLLLCVDTESIALRSNDNRLGFGVVRE